MKLICLLYAYVHACLISGSINGFGNPPFNKQVELGLSFIDAFNKHVGVRVEGLSPFTGALDTNLTQSEPLTSSS